MGKHVVSKSTNLHPDRLDEARIALLEPLDKLRGKKVQFMKFS